MSEMAKCQVCDSAEWMPLPDPNRYQVVTTASRIIREPLGKSQCRMCGFVQRTRAKFLGMTDYYEQDYANYYERAGTGKYHKERYKVIVDWMHSFLVYDNQMKTAIDVGCGQGWAMDAFRDHYPNMNTEGLEPSHFNVKVAREKGFKVYEGKLEELRPEPHTYDVVFSNNVIQHVNDARAFLAQLKELVAQNGVIIITCPDGSRPNIEILWGDQNFSFLPIHLINLGKSTGFNTVFWASSSISPSLPPAQLLLLTNNPAYETLTLGQNALNTDIKDIYEKRVKYLSSFEQINTYLLNEIGAQTAYNFGASYWTSVLAAYCPEYWNKVKACLVDENAAHSKFLEKNILLTSAVVPRKTDILVVGTGPGWQEKLKKRFSEKWNKVITWDSFVNY